MFGWYISIIDESLKVSNENRFALLAKWTTSPRGENWLIDLVEAKKAIYHSHIDGTGRCRAIASDVLPIIANGPPVGINPIVLPGIPKHPVSENWVSDITFHHDRMASCQPDQKLIIDVFNYLAWNDYINYFEETEKKIGYFEFKVKLSDEDDLTTGKLAQWETGTNGLNYFDDLVKTNQATLVKKGGYPMTYKVLAGDVLHLLMDGSLFHIDNTWTADIIVYHDRIARCPQDRMLTIEAWDMS